MSLPEIKPGLSLTEKAYETIKDAITSFVFLPNERLSIRELVEKLGVSRTPVTAALKQLEQDGLVYFVPKKGVFVTDLEEINVKEIFELRILFESYSTRHATPLLTQEEIDYAENLLKLMKDYLSKELAFDFAQAGHEFHKLLLEKQTNSRMNKFLDQLGAEYSRIRRFYYDEMDTNLMQASIADHKRILDAIKDRDPDKAEEAIHSHLSRVRDELLNMMEKRSFPKQSIESKVLE